MIRKRSERAPRPAKSAEAVPASEKSEEPSAAEGAVQENVAEDPAQPAKKATKRGKKKPKPDFGELALRLEALLFASNQTLGTRRLAKALEVSGEDAKQGLEALQRIWAERKSALELVEVSGGWRLLTRAAYHDDVGKLTAKAKVEKLSSAALETLAVVAYRQPLGRADIEAVRGVQCGPLLRVLLDRDLIRIAGRSSEPGHPLLYGTSKRFLDHFGLASLKNLPDVKDLLNAS
ncbi:MAG: SMC-Scp complex subunit ScpB [Planctomycetota bacterium]|jgi:segregation and condensation protein B|nr:SMC-Scp complex subunit ScpB [Planctomycetota bacterium]